MPKDRSTPTEVLAAGGILAVTIATVAVLSVLFLF